MQTKESLRKKSGACDKKTRRRKNPKYMDLINELQNKILIEHEPATVLQQCFDYSCLIYLFFIHLFIQKLIFFTDSQFH